jgi:hypothetical protein
LIHIKARSRHGVQSASRHNREHEPMTFAELFYVGGMSAITVAFPTLLVGMMALNRNRPRPVAVLAPIPVVEPLRRAA